MQASLFASQWLTHQRLSSPRVALFALAILLGGVAVSQENRGAAKPERQIPGAPHLLPHDTLLYARFDDAEALRVDLADSSIGRMFADPKLKPFANDLYATLGELFETVGQPLGITLEELLAIPSGQVAAAAFPRVISDAELERLNEGDESEEAIRERLDRKRRAQTAMAGLFIIDAGKNVGKLRTLLDRMLEQPIQSGYVRRQQAVGSVTLVRLVPPRPGRPEIEYFEKDDCIVLGIGHQTAAAALDRWLDRSDEPTFADNVDFSAVMSRSLGAEETQPQLTFYADPYHLIERIIKRGGAAAIVWPILEDLGIDKIRGIGGSIFRGGETFDDITHLHVLIDPPRDGLFGVLRPQPVATTPPPFVPADVTTYTSIAWDVQTTFDNLSKVIDRFQGEGTAKRALEDRFQEQSGVDLREEVLSNLSGRYVGIRWLQPPVKINSQAGVYAFEVTDANRAEATLEKLVQRLSPNMKPVMVGTHRLYTREAGGGKPTANLRRPEPSAMLLGDWLLLGDSRQLMERAVRAEGGALPRLADVPEYDLVLSELGGKLDGEKPFLITFVRGADFLRQLYQVAESEDSKNFLRAAAERNPFAAKFDSLLRRNQLPPFEQFEKYFAPGGGFAYDEPNGIHIGSFTLKADAE